MPRSNLPRLAAAITLAGAMALALSPALAVAQPAVAQGLGGIVRGTVTSQDEAGPVAGAIVDLREAASGRVAATTVTSQDGKFTLYGLPDGIYAIEVGLVGFERETTLPFRVVTGAPVDMTIAMRLAASSEVIDVVGRSTLVDEARGAIDPTVSARLLEVAPVPGENLFGLLPLLPGVVRGPDGRLAMRGGPPSQGLFVVSSANLVDPSTGDLAFEPPSDAVDRVEVVSSPFAAEFGRFTASVTRLRLRTGGESWQFVFNDLIPRPLKKSGGGWRGVKAFTPRLSIGGPLRQGRLYLAQSLEARYVRTAVKSLPEWPTIDLRSFDAFTRLDAVLSTRHHVALGVAVFPRAIDRISMATFRPPGAVPDYRQNGFNVGLLDSLVIAPWLVLETNLSYRQHDVDIEPRSSGPMVLSPAGAGGTFFNEQDRHARSLQLVHTVTWSTKLWGMEHLFKAGVDLFATSYTGTSTSAPVEIRRADGSLAELLTFTGTSHQDVSGADFAVFVQDQWRPGQRVAVDFGARLDRDGTIRRVNVSPRVMVTMTLDREGASVLRAGLGHFTQRTPLNVGAFESFERPLVTRFAPGGKVAGTFDLVPTRASMLDTPSSVVVSAELTRRLSKRVVVKAGYLHRRGSHEYLVEPQPGLNRMMLTSAGRSRYHEMELTGRFMASARHDVSVSYVRSRGEADLNAYDAAYGNVRWPIVRPNEFSLAPTDVPNRVIARGTIGLPWKLDLFPVVEWRDGFPWSAVDEEQQFVGARNRSGRLPRVFTLDFSLSRPVRIRKWDVRLGFRAYRAIGTSASRDVQNNTASPEFGQFYHPIRRELGLVFVVGK